MTYFDYLVLMFWLMLFRFMVIDTRSCMSVNKYYHNREYDTTESEVVNGMIVPKERKGS